METLTRFAPQVLSILRIVTAAAYFEHGTQKMFAFPTPPAGGHTVAIGSLLGAAALLELILSPFVFVGLFTRYAALLLSGEMAVGYFMFHQPKSFFPIINGGDAALLYCFIFFYLIFAGGGAWSLDRALGRKD